MGHSFAGKVVAGVADRAPERVRMVLYLDAFRPAKVRTPQGGFPDEFRLDGSGFPFTEEILDSIGKDVRGADREWMQSKVTPWPARYSREPVALSEKFDSVKSAYVFCTGGGDDVAQVLTGKLDGPYKVMETGHWPMVTRPEELVAHMLALAGAPER